MYKKRSWQSLVDRVPGLGKTLSISRAFKCAGGEGNGGTAYRTGTYYGFAADLGQLRLRYNRQALFIDLDRGQQEINGNNVNNNNLNTRNLNNNNSNHNTSFRDPRPSSSTAADDHDDHTNLSSLPITVPTTSSNNYTTITIPWSQLRKLKRRSAETVEFCFSTANLPPAFFSLVPKLIFPKTEKDSSSNNSWSIAVHFAMGVSEDLLAEMSLLGLVRKVRYGFWKLRKCYIPVAQMNTVVVAAAARTGSSKESFA